MFEEGVFGKPKYYWMCTIILSVNGNGLEYKRPWKNMGLPTGILLQAVCWRYNFSYFNSYLILIKNLNTLCGVITLLFEAVSLLRERDISNNAYRSCVYKVEAFFAQFEGALKKKGKVLEEHKKVLGCPKPKSLMWKII